jgi:hypothetical protein
MEETGNVPLALKDIEPYRTYYRYDQALKEQRKTMPINASQNDKTDEEVQDEPMNIDPNVSPTFRLLHHCLRNQAKQVPIDEPPPDEDKDNCMPDYSLDSPWKMKLAIRLYDMRREHTRKSRDREERQRDLEKDCNWKSPKILTPKRVPFGPEQLEEARKKLRTSCAKRKENCEPALPLAKPEEMKVCTLVAPLGAAGENLETIPEENPTLSSSLVKLEEKASSRDEEKKPHVETRTNSSERKRNSGIFVATLKKTVMTITPLVISWAVFHLKRQQ